MAPSSIVELAGGLDPDLVGGKAATLGRLAAAGFPVPAGLVVTEPDGAAAGLVGAARRAGPGPYAVRSSGTAEDLADASYAGLYETFLNVGADRLAAAVADCFTAAAAERVRAYEQRRLVRRPDQPDGQPTMAVLVQQMVDATAAGVAFTAHPITGNRDEALVTAIQGLGEDLVAGVATGEEWTVRSGRAEQTRAAPAGIGSVLSSDRAREVAALANNVARTLGGPQDIEWATDGHRLYLLQARPMTALPDPVTWQAPGPGLWMRNFRLGEWLPEAMTPLFADWLLPAIEDGYLAGLRATAGTTVPFRYASVHGWYYNAPPTPTPRLLAKALFESRGRVVKVLFNALIRVGRNPGAADRAVLAGLYRTWQDDQLPAYRQLVDAGEQAVDHAEEPELAGWVDRVGHAAGRHLWILAIVGGSAWKIEACLTTFYRTHLPGVLERYDGVQALLRGLPGTEPGRLPPHAVHSIDWHRPTSGETTTGQHTDRGEVAERHRRLAGERAHAEDACRTALADRPRQLARFNQLLEVAQRYAVIREEQSKDLTLGWPLLRRCVLRIGGHLQAAGIIDDVEDVFFLHRADLDTTRGQATKADLITARRATWQRQCRLSPPLTLGAAPRLIGDLIGKAVETARGGEPTPSGAILGHPASAGRATGTVHIINGPDDFAAFRGGEILVAKATTPAWTPLFGRAAAVVTDGGSLAAHASLVAREYGIPAVVGTGNATHRLHSGQLVAVDGTHGTITLATEQT